MGRNKKNNRLFSRYVVVLVCLLGSWARAATLEVGSGKTYSTIQAAVDAASGGTMVYSNHDQDVSGDDIVVYAGTYDGFTVDGNHYDYMTIQAYKDPADCNDVSERVVISGPISIQNWAEGSTFRGFYIANTTANATCDFGTAARFNTWRNCVIYGSSDAAIYGYAQWGANLFDHCTIYDNGQAVDMTYISQVKLNNCIVAFNDSGYSGIVHNDSDYNCLFDNPTGDPGYGSITPGDYDINLDPLFVSTNPASKYFLYLDPSSPCVGAAGDGGDMGALPYVPPDCNGNGIPDANDIASGTSQDCNGNGIPDECDIADETSTDVDEDGVPDECQPDDVRIMPVAVLVDPSTTPPECNSLPDSIAIPEPGTDYYVEIWATYLADPNEGLTGVYVDVSFCEQMSATGFDHGTIFTAFTEGSIQGGGASVENFGGSNFSPGLGNEPNWVRIGWIDMHVDTAASTCTISLSPAGTGAVAAFGRGTVPNVFVEFGSTTLFRDCNGNGIPDANDIDSGTSPDCDGNGIPDECDIADDPNLDCNGNGILDECDIADGNSPDCDGNDVPDECDIANDPNLDCNGNGVPDQCDIASQTSLDCNGNGIPDECEIADDPNRDCNGNSIPDDCDIASETSSDFDENGIPDECQIDDVQIIPVLVLIDPNITSETRTAEPVSITSVVRSGKYYIEIWASDTGDENTGLTNVYVDISFCSQTSATSLAHGTIFTDSTSGTIQADGIDEFGGSADPGGDGVEPEWVRIGWVEMIADLDIATCSISLQESAGGIAALGRGTIPWIFVDLGSVDLEITAPARTYDLEVNELNIINVGDLSLFAPSWLKSVPTANIACDFDCDCFVGPGDLSWFATGWLKNINDPTIIYPPCPDPNCEGEGMSALGCSEGIFGPFGAGSSTDIAFELAILNTPSALEETTVLPSSINSISSGQTYYVEVWVSDVGDINTGLVSAYLDISYPADGADVVSISHGSIFSTFTSGTKDVPGHIDELGGSALPAVASEPNWVRLAMVEMIQADPAPDAITFTCSGSATGVTALARGYIDWADISLDTATVPMFTISGYIQTAGAAGAEQISVTAEPDGGTAITDPNGYYELEVPSGFSGTVTPDSDQFDLSFVPVSQSYSNVTSDRAQNYTVSNDCDLSGNDVVNFLDYAIFANSWRISSTGLDGDFNNNDIVDEYDLAILIRNYLWGP